MKLIELQICNVRGIRQLSLKPKGKNLVIWGPNGSGKSAVVDALDFLLTGKIARLHGKGTSTLKLNEHGPHVDCQPEEAKVRAIFQFPGTTSQIELKRCVARPSKLEYDSQAVKPQLEKIIDLAQRGLHILTRRELIKYITADAKTRAQEIEALLNIDEVGKIRQTLVKVQNNFDKEVKVAESNVKSAKGAVNATTQEETFQSAAVLKIVNQNRKILGGEPISNLRSSDLKTGLTSYTVVSSNRTADINLLGKYISNLLDVLSEQSQLKIARDNEQLSALVAKIHSEPELQSILSHYQLIQLGLPLIDRTGSCPLCDTSWPIGELQAYLNRKLLIAQVAAKDIDKIKKLSDVIAEHANNTVASIEKVVSALEVANVCEDIDFFQSWLTNLCSYIKVLGSATEKYPDPQFTLSQVKRMLAPDSAIEALNRVYSTVKNKYPEATPEQTAWDTLTRLEENLKALEAAERNLEDAKLLHQRATILLDSFLQARDKILGKLYDSVKSRFVELYQQLHEHDGEGSFLAKIEPKGAGVNFEVDFYGRGTHPPHALHSEGHQDSMGICLYLALVERLTEGIIDLVILDDVVMSVDADHRREFCHLIANSFPERQFLIATHDKTWANQLKTEGVVDSKGTIEFYNWRVETGPQVSDEVDLWHRIEEDLVKNDVPSAATKLRRGSEEFFAIVCDLFRARVPFKLSGRWDLGDFLYPAMGQYSELLKKAKIAADSWSNEEDVERLKELESIKKSIYSRLHAEQWAVNANVHYNNWANFSINDFKPVVEAFQDLHSLFKCNKCDGLLRPISIGMEEVSVRCNCGVVNWNLTKRKS